MAGNPASKPSSESDTANTVCSFSSMMTAGVLDSLAISAASIKALPSSTAYSFVIFIVPLSF